MAYFDSAKNSALWKKELDGLRAERARREAGGYSPAGKKQTEAGMANPAGRIRITYAQLEREEYESVRKQKGEKAARSETREKTASHSSTMERGAEASV